MPESEMQEGKVTTTEESGASESSVYELGYHILSSVTEADLGAEVTAIRAAIEARGGVFVADEFPKETPLSYEMVKVSVGKRSRHSKAYFGWFKFEANPAEAATILKNVEAMPMVLRAILIKTVRENTMLGKRIFVSDRMEGETIKRREVKKETSTAPVSEEELDRSIEKMVVE